MDREVIRQALYEKYIEPTKKKAEKYIGVEIEMPIVNLSKAAVDFDVVHSITLSFINRFGFKPSGKDDDGNIYSAESPENGDIFSYDCSYNNLELSFGREKNLYNIQNRFFKYYKYLNKEFGRFNYTLTGMGVNPYRKYNQNIPIPNGRYRMLFHHLGSYKKYRDLPMLFHSYPEYGTFSSASQVQLDVSYEDLPLVLNTFSKLEPIKALLFSNSVLLGENEELLCCRDMFWENSTHGINPHNIGMYDYEFSSIDEILSYIESSSIYCLERADKYINFTPTRLMDYFDKQSVTGEYFDGLEYKTIKFTPKLDDIEYLRTFKFIDLTYRGTIEFRSMCCQPINDSMCIAAFHLGLMNKVKELSRLFQNDRVLYHRGYNAPELRKLLIRRRLPSFIDADNLYALTKKIIDLSYEGLSERKLNEENFLAPLYDRVKLRTNPAKNMLELKNSGVDLQDIILKYGEIEDIKSELYSIPLNQN